LREAGCLNTLLRKKALANQRNAALDTGQHRKNYLNEIKPLFIQACQEMQAHPTLEGGLYRLHNLRGLKQNAKSNGVEKWHTQVQAQRKKSCLRRK
jgi:hypothetical protein